MKSGAITLHFDLNHHYWIFICRREILFINRWIAWTSFPEKGENNCALRLEWTNFSVISLNCLFPNRFKCFSINILSNGNLMKSSSIKSAIEVYFVWNLVGFQRGKKHIRRCLNWFRHHFSHRLADQLHLRSMAICSPFVDCISKLQVNDIRFMKWCIVHTIHKMRKTLSDNANDE